MIDAPRSFDNDAARKEDLRRQIGEHLQDDASVRSIADTPSASHLLQLILSEPLSAPGEPVVHALEVRLRPLGDDVELSTSVRVDVGGDIVAATVGAFDTAWSKLTRLRILDVSRDANLLRALTDPDPVVREFVIERLGERHVKVAVKPLCELMRQETEPSLVLKAVGALVALGDRRAVGSLIELSHQKDASFVLQVVFAVGALGGRTAEAYLVTMASGHPDEEVRQGAQDALDEMLRRRKTP